MPRASPGAIAQAGIAEFARETFGEFQARRGGIARADDGDHRARQSTAIAAHREERRRVVDRGQARADSGFAEQVHAYFALALLAFVALHIGVAIQDYMTDQRP